MNDWHTLSRIPGIVVCSLLQQRFSLWDLPRCPQATRISMLSCAPIRWSLLILDLMSVKAKVQVRYVQFCEICGIQEEFGLRKTVSWNSNVHERHVTPSCYSEWIKTIDFTVNIVHLDEYFTHNIRHKWPLDSTTLPTKENNASAAH